MNARWRSWLLPLLLVSFGISAFEVNTDDIVNTWGDCYDAYIPAEFVADADSSATVSPRHDTGHRCFSLFVAATHSPLPALAAGPRPARRSFIRYERVFLYCCQWLI